MLWCVVLSVCGCGLESSVVRCVFACSMVAHVMVVCCVMGWYGAWFGAVVICVI